MPVGAIALVLASCLGHASWNYLTKRSRDQVATMWWALVASLVVLSPLTVVRFFVLGADWPATVWLCLLGAATAQAVYITSLLRAYATGDLSVVYPIARSAPLFVAVWAALWLGESLSVVGGAGIVLVVGGAALLAIPGRHADGVRGTGSAIAWAVLTALASSLYSVADRAAMLNLSGWLDRVAYLNLEFMGMWAGLSLVAIRGKPWRRWRDGDTVRQASVIGLLQPATYFLVLMAMSIGAAQVSGIVALRQFSVVLGVLFGWRLLREPRGWVRLVSAVVMVVGLILVVGPWRR